MARKGKGQKKKKVLLGITGGIAAYKACEVVRRLQEKGCEVSVVMTRAATAFITPLTLATLSGGPVISQVLPRETQGDIPHISEAQEADVFLIAPATANIIGKIANGLADDAVSCMALSTTAKILIAPAMNERMFQNVAVQENIAKLKTRGIEIVEPSVGKLACGVTGQGHLADVEILVEKTLRSLKRK